MDHIRSSSRIGGFLRRKSYCVPQASNKDMFGLGLDSRDPLMKRIVTQPLEFQTTGPQTTTFTIISIFAPRFFGHDALFVTRLPQDLQRAFVNWFARKTKILKYRSKKRKSSMLECCVRKMKRSCQHGALDPFRTTQKKTVGKKHSVKLTWQQRTWKIWVFPKMWVPPNHPC